MRRIGVAVYLSEEWYGFTVLIGSGSAGVGKRLERVHPEDRFKWKSTSSWQSWRKPISTWISEIVLPDGMVKWIPHRRPSRPKPSGRLVQFVGSSWTLAAQTAEEELQQLVDFVCHIITVLSQTARLLRKPFG